MIATQTRIPSARMIAAVKAFLARHPEYRKQVYAEWYLHLEQEPFLTLEKVLVGYERGGLPGNPMDPFAAPHEVVDYGVYALTGRMRLAWQDLSDGRN